MKRWQTISLVLCSSALIFLLGLYFGLENSNKEEGFSAKDIAIVNLDEGVVYQKKQRFFSTELLQGMGTNYIVTGLSDARNGLKNGQYGAYIIIPADYSTKVISINHGPEKIQYNYEISGDLLKDVKSEVIIQVNDFDRLMNLNLSSLFIDSILSEFHTGQSGGSIILKNDNEEVKLIEAIQASDLTTMIEIRELEPVDNLIEELDITQQEEKSVELINNIDQSYKAFIELSNEQLETIKLDYDNLDISFLPIDNELLGFSPLKKVDKTSNVEWINLDAYINNFNETLGIDGIQVKLEEELLKINVKQNLANDVEESIQNQILKFLQDNPYKSYADAMDYFSTNEELDDEVTMFFEYLEISDKSTIIDYYLYYSLNGATPEVNADQEVLNEIYQNILDLDVKLSADDIHTKISDDLETIYTSQQLTIENITTHFNALKNGYTILSTKLVPYNPKENIDEKVISEIVKEQNENVAGLMAAVDTKNQEYMKFVNEVESISSEHISGIQEDVVKADEASKTLLEASLTLVKETKSLNSNENQDLLNSFISSLTYMQTGSLENQEAIGFIANPAELSGTIGVSTITNKENKLQDNLIIMIIITSVLIASTLLVVLVSKRKTQQE